MRMTKCRMAEWQYGGMAEWRDGKWQNGRMAEWYFTTYLIYPAIFMVHDNDTDNDAADIANDDADDTNGFQII